MKLSNEKIRACFVKKVPIFQWLPNYDKHTALSDLVAGITVGLTLIPQSIAYAALAGLGPQYGLYASISGGLVYMVFGTIPEINIAPTALLSLLTHNYTHDTHPAFAVLLCFLSGIIELICGLLNLGFLVDFVSVPVVSGFTSAAAIIIASAQVKNLLGLKFQAEGFVEIWINIFKLIGHTKLWDAVLSVSCCSVLLAMKKLNDYPKISEKEEVSEKKKKLKTILWFLSVSRNAIVVVVCAVVAYVFYLKDMKPFSLTDQVEAGLPPIKPPPFEVFYNNHTANFAEIISHLGSGVIVVPLVAIIGNIAIAKAFANGKTIEASQEMLCLGICNIIGAFFSSMPVNGSFSRSAVNNASGVKTPFGGLYTGILVLLALSFLTPYFSYIPKATLSSVIICAVIFMVEISIIKPMWKINRLNLIPFVVTFVACLALGVELGILVGIIIDLLFMLYYAARPRIEVEPIIVENSNGPNYTTLKPEGAMLFPAVEHMRKAISKAGNSSKVVVIDCIYVTRADYTSAQGLGNAVKDMKKAGTDVIFLRANPEIKSTLQAYLGEKYVFIDTDDELQIYLTDTDNNPEDARKEIKTIIERRFSQPKDDSKFIEISLNNSEMDDFMPQMNWKVGKPIIERRWTHAAIIVPNGLKRNSITRL